jgi:hypothetical protein
MCNPLQMALVPQRTSEEHVTSNQLTASKHESRFSKAVKLIKYGYVNCLYQIMFTV